MRGGRSWSDQTGSRASPTSRWRRARLIAVLSVMAPAATRVLASSDLAVLDTWLDRAAVATSPHEMFAD